ncbi:histidine kinase dimerization/phospho-acceptor domain-containing protein, partial [Micromonospora zhanjiangensis]
MDWEVVVAGVTGGALAGLAVALLILWRTGARHGTPAGRVGWRGVPGTGRSAIVQEEQDRLAELGRKSLDSLRAGVVVLDGGDVPVLVNPAARAMGLLRAGAEPGTVTAHPILRTVAGQVRRTGVRQEVELDVPRGRPGGTQEPLGVHLRAMALGGGYVAVEAVDVTESHRVARVRRDFVANVSHELKTPIGALQLLAEALL